MVNEQTDPHRVHHVVPRPSGGWAIKRAGTAEAIKLFSTRGDAIEFVHQISHEQGAKVVIHGQDGQIMSTHTYGDIEHCEDRPESGFGCARGLIVMSPDFDDPLEELSGYI